MACLWCRWRSLAAGIALVGSLLGFLRFNFSPARIFLGDSGSMFLGFVLAVVSIRGSQKGTTAVAVLAPMLVLGLPILDTALAILRRTWRIALQGASEQRSLAWIVRNSHMVFLPDRGHLHHRLLEVGLSQRRAVLVLYGIGLLLAIAALADVVMDSVWVALVHVGALAVLIFAFLAGHEILARRHRARRASGGGWKKAWQGASAILSSSPTVQAETLMRRESGLFLI